MRFTCVEQGIKSMRGVFSDVGEFFLVAVCSPEAVS